MKKKNHKWPYPPMSWVRAYRTLPNKLPVSSWMNHFVSKPLVPDHFADSSEFLNQLLAQFFNPQMLCLYWMKRLSCHLGGIVKLDSVPHHSSEVSFFLPKWKINNLGSENLQPSTFLLKTTILRHCIMYIDESHELQTIHYLRLDHHFLHFFHLDGQTCLVSASTTLEMIH